MMKLLMLFYSGPTPQRVASLLDRHPGTGYTEFRNVHGAGSSGRREGTRAWPGESSLFITITPTEHVADLVNRARAEAAALDSGERLHVAVLPAETFF
jgi:hypothetical protein